MVDLVKTGKPISSQVYLLWRKSFIAILFDDENYVLCACYSMRHHLA